jgi:hypothetical protein
MSSEAAAALTEAETASANLLKRNSDELFACVVLYL